MVKDILQENKHMVKTSKNNPTKCMVCGKEIPFNGDRINQFWCSNNCYTEYISLPQKDKNISYQDIMKG